MFSQVSQPLRYAEALFRHYARLARSHDDTGPLTLLVEATAQLAACPLAQLYLLDDSHTHLTLCAEWLDGCRQARSASLPSDYASDRLLQYCLCQNQPLALGELLPSLHQTPFLPAGNAAWRSLLCLPLGDDRQGLVGLLVCADRLPRKLLGYASSLTHLGGFALSQRQLHQRRPASSPCPAAPALAPQASSYGLIGDSPAMQDVFRLLGKILDNSVSVLLSGETGTGKELVAGAIHQHGQRCQRPFVVQNCAALPENLLESELFGYRKGAFTGADRDRKGLFDAADGGTLFLDEIGDMPLSLQAKLLRVLQEGEVRPLGGSATHRVDVRLIAATHRNLRALVEQGRFREDLYYRLANFPIELPPLRERQQDIPRLARHFAEQASEHLQRPHCRWAENALAQLVAYAFPGNVRELKALVERAVLLCEDGELLPEHFALPTCETAAEPAQNLRERLEGIERGLLLDCLRKNRGNQSRAARELGLPRRTLLYRMSRLRISPADQ
ncbi:Anaerobic nitric oxide reductase transcription regulator NorR [compost metagenome]